MRKIKQLLKEKCDTNEFNNKSVEKSLPCLNNYS